jgi:hypothetical protein
VSTPPPATPSPPPARVHPANGDVTVEYLERSNIRVRGAVTGRTYAFSFAHAAQRVDRRDTTALLASGFFRALT